jgi:hypothetical protein
MYHGRYIRWNPLPARERRRLYCEAVHDDWEGFRIWLRPDTAGPMLIVTSHGVQFYACSNESKRLATIANQAPLDFPHAFWIVEDSALLAEFHRQSCSTTDDLKITHYAILSASDCVDVLALEPPVFSGL